MNIHWILFLCSGNYYRSRMAEAYLNCRARGMCINWRASSRALSADLTSLGNVGSLSIHARRMLEKAGVPVNNGKRMPLAVTESDLSDAEIVVAMSRNEHEQMFYQRYPTHAVNARFWDVEDIHIESPDIAFGKITEHVDSLLDALLD